MSDHDPELIERAAKALHEHDMFDTWNSFGCIQSSCKQGYLDRASAVLDAVADDLRAEVEIRWMKVAVMRDGEAIREAQEAAWDAGMAAGQAWGRRVNAPYPRNPYRKEADR